MVKSEMLSNSQRKRRSFVCSLKPKPLLPQSLLLHPLLRKCLRLVSLMGGGTLEDPCVADSLVVGSCMVIVVGGTLIPTTDLGVVLTMDPTMALIIPIMDRMVVSLLISEDPMAMLTRMSMLITPPLLSLAMVCSLPLTRSPSLLIALPTDPTLATLSKSTSMA